MSKYLIFLRSLRLLYTAVLHDTWIGLRSNLHHYLLHLILVVLSSATFWAIRPFPGFAGALLSGFIFACFLSVYLSSVSAAVRQERVSLMETTRLAVDMFPAVFRVLFVLFMCTIVVHSLTREVIVLLFVSLCIAIYWNAALEASYQEDDFSWQDFGLLWPFIRANAVEWFLPLFVVSFVLACIEGSKYAEKVFILLFATHPVQFIQILSSLGGSPTVLLAHWWQSVLFLLILYPAFIFRGVLYKFLNRSNRRKRIFEAQF